MPKPNREIADGHVYLSIAALAEGDEQIAVDADGRRINGVVVMQVGEVSGIGFRGLVDEVTLGQVSEEIQARAKQIAVHNTHNHVFCWIDEDEGVAGDLGYPESPRRDGDRLRADVQFYQQTAPEGEADIVPLLLSRAAENPRAIAVSIHARMDEPEYDRDEAGRVVEGALPRLRIAKLKSIDFVREGAATPEGLFSAPQPSPRPAGRSTHDPDPDRKESTMSKGKDDPTKAGGNQTDPPAKNEPSETNPAAGDKTAMGATDPAPKPQPGRGFEVTLERASKGLEQYESLDLAFVNAAAKRASSDDHFDAILKNEHDRRTGIAGLAKRLDLGDEWANDRIEAGTDFPVAMREAERAKNSSPEGQPTAGLVRGGEDNRRKGLVLAARQALEYRMTGRVTDENGEKDVEPERLALRVANRGGMLGIGELCLQARGIDTDQYMDDLTMARVALTAREPAEVALQIGHSTSDFPYHLADTMNKVGLIRYRAAARTWQGWCGRRVTRDFRNLSMIQRGLIGAMQKRLENGTFERTTFSENREQGRVYVYGVEFDYSFEMMVNDDMGFLGQIVEDGFDNAILLEEETAYTPITSNGGVGQVMAEDGLNLFDAGTHDNYITASGIPTIDRIAASKTKILRQTDLSGRKVVVGNDWFIITPPELEDRAAQLIASPVDIDKSNQTPNVETVRRTRPISTNQLDDADAWYFGVPGRTVQMLFLQGYESPSVNRYPDNRSMGVVLQFAHIVGSKAADWRGIVKQDGTA